MRAGAHALWTGFTLWLATHESAMCTLAAVGAVTGRDRVPAVFGGALYRSTLGLLAETTLCVLMRPTDAGSSADALSVRRFGPQEDLTPRLISQLEAWEATGRPATTCLRIRAYPQGTAYIPSSTEVVVAKPHTYLILDWS